MCLRPTPLGEGSGWLMELKDRVKRFHNNVRIEEIATAHTTHF
ncbi:hypothetical protein HRbin01_00088 [archaeon HR01]|nr:hypothetical protein HRbin01_00088 [archaeon HR01]